MSNAPYNPTRLVLLSELTTKEKELYYNLLILNEAKFHRNEQGQYIANVRLLAPSIHKVESVKKKRDPNETNTFPFEERLKHLQDNGRIVINLVGIDEFDYHSYQRFSALIANPDDTVKPRLKLLSWLMRYIEDLYDSRFAHEAADIGREESLETAEKISGIFPVFVVKRLSMKVGLRSIIDQTCWDLLYNAHIYRRDYLEVEMFCRFLQEFYDHDDLLFFLYVRSVVAKQLHVSFKTRWGKSDGPGRQPKSLWLSYRECVSVARSVFGEANEGMCRDFLAIVSPQMVGQKHDTTGGGSDTRRIDITQFLHLAVVGYHQTRPPEEGEDGRRDDEGFSHGHSHAGQGQGYSIGKGGDSGRVQESAGYRARGLSEDYPSGQGRGVSDDPLLAPSGGAYMTRLPRSNSNNTTYTQAAYVNAPAMPVSSSQGFADGERVVGGADDRGRYEQEAPARAESFQDAGGYYSPEGNYPHSAADDDFLSRMARDREEILNMQRQMGLGDSGGMDDSFLFGVEESNIKNLDYGSFQYSPTSEFMDPMMADPNIDLSALAGGYSPVSAPAPALAPKRGSAITADQRGAGAQKRPTVSPRMSLTDFTKQRQQMAELEAQYAIPDVAARVDEQGSEQDDDEEEEEARDEFVDHFDFPEQQWTDGGAGEGGSYSDNRVLSEIQMGREKEFLELFCERLSGLPEEIATSIIDELADRLRQKLTSHLLANANQIDDADEFDDVVVNYLQSEELQSDMESARDIMLEYVEKRRREAQLRGGGRDMQARGDREESPEPQPAYEQDEYYESSPYGYGGGGEGEGDLYQDEEEEDRGRFVATHHEDNFDRAEEGEGRYGTQERYGFRDPQNSYDRRGYDDEEGAAAYEGDGVGYEQDFAGGYGDDGMGGYEDRGDDEGEGGYD